MIPSQIRALLFDCDGVLVQTNGLHYKAFLRVLEPYGITEFDYSTIAGLSTADGLKKICPSLGENEASLNEKVLEKQTHFRELSERSGTDVFPDLSSLFRELSRSHSIAVVSSASRRSLDEAIRRCRIGEWIKISLSAEDVSQTKPDPEPYRKACLLLDVDPSNAVVIEDAESGIMAGRSAGCETLGFRIGDASLGRIDSLLELLSKRGASQ